MDREALPEVIAVATERLWLEVPSEAPVRATEMEADELLNVEQTAKRIGKSKSWVYHNGRDLPFCVRGIGSAPRFSRKGLEQYIKRQRA